MTIHPKNQAELVLRQTLRFVDMHGWTAAIENGVHSLGATAEMSA